MKNCIHALGMRCRKEILSLSYWKDLLPSGVDVFITYKHYLFLNNSQEAIVEHKQIKTPVMLY
jgi:hypothetical protein